ncbi:MAG: hypothetical protein KGD74_05845 [Candidatus Lokiarchaeota archaeon]|nr:hypothetical protein [Candidatus Lokiarchaeota archaeon]
MDKKDVLIGILAIVTVGLAGGLGYIIIANPLSGGTTTPVLNQGLPDDWSTAPNSSILKLYDVHGVEYNITIGEILDGVQVYLDDLEADSLSEWKNYYELTTIQDPISGQYVTGVNILDILEEKGIYFAGDLEFETEDSVSREIHTADIITKSYAKKGKTYFVLVLAINQEWLQYSPYYASMGNFSIMGLDPNDNFYNFNQVTVMNNWTIDINVNGTIEFSLDAWDLIQNPYTAVYRVDSTTGWGANRQYWGKNVSEIIAMTSANVEPDYEVVFRSADGFTTPSTKWGELPYNKSEVEIGMYNNGTHVIPRSDDDYVNGTSTTGVPIPATDLIMNLAWKIQELGETYDGIADDAWPVPKILSYFSGPFNVQIPGRDRSSYAKWVTEIIIDF